MAQHYSDPGRAVLDTALPDIETFEWSDEEAQEYFEDREATGGWYFWFCFPGCMPDSQPVGPFETEQEAIDEAQDRGD